MWQIIKWIYSDGVVCLPLSFRAAGSGAAAAVVVAIDAAVEIVVVVAVVVVVIFPCAFPLSAGFCYFHIDSLRAAPKTVKNELPSREPKQPSIFLHLIRFVWCFSSKRKSIPFSVISGTY